MKRDLLSCDLPELERFVGELGEPRFRAAQIFQWIHGKGVFSVEEMSNLPLQLRTTLAPHLGGLPLTLDGVLEDRDGTRKFRFRLSAGDAIESVWMPGKKHATLCMSTQVGCRMGCAFCRTAKMGWKRDLEAGEIVAQLYAVRAMPDLGSDVTHVVLMGMGEPLDNLDNTLRALRVLTDPLGPNLSTRRVTVSTVGFPGVLERVLQEVPVSVTVSLNAADDETRSRLMPVNRRYGLEALIETLRQLPLAPRRRITIAYVLVRGVNDAEADAVRLARLLHGIRCKVNLIPLNPFPGSELVPPEEAAVLAFQLALRNRGVSTYIRFSKGSEILAACGQLAGKSPR